MKLLFDENLSVRLFAGRHIRAALMSRSFLAAAEQMRKFASKDGDFRQRAFVAGPPPKVVWLAVGNAGTMTIAELLRSRRSQIEAFAISAEQTVLILAV